MENWKLGFENFLFTIVNRYPVSKPYLARDAPVMKIFHPLEICFFKTIGYNGNFIFFNNLYGLFFQRFPAQNFCGLVHAYKPLLGRNRFDEGPTPIADRYIIF